MKYNVGDKVRIKSLDWYNKNKDEHGDIDISHDFTFYADRSKYCGRVFTISEVFDNSYFVKEDNNEYYWSDEMFEGLAEEEIKPNIIEEAKTYWDSIKDAWICPEGYIFKDENGNVINTQKIVLEKKKKEYPKTYEECCKILGIENSVYLTSDKEGHWNDYELGLNYLIEHFRKLLICRDAYWEIAGEEMGLGKPWEPEGENTFGIFYDRLTDEIEEQNGYHGANSTFEFSTPEMRDAFYENFKELINECKELL